MDNKFRGGHLSGLFGFQGFVTAVNLADKLLVGGVEDILHGESCSC